MGSDVIHPLLIQPIDAEYVESFRANVAEGMRLAEGEAINVVAIARNACPHLINTFACIDSMRPYFGKLRCYFFENDSTDDTAAELDRYADSQPNVVVEHDTLGRPDYRGWEEERTTFLAEYRNRCRDYVEANWSDAAWTMVIDMDPHGGFLPDGVFNSIHWFGEFPRAGAMASYSIIRQTSPEGELWWAHYDAFAARPMCWWRDRKKEIGMGWFSHFIPPVGAPPIRMNSAFGGLCLYDTRAYLSSRYSGAARDCEHVNFHRGMASAGWELYLNPGSVYAAVLG